MSIYPQTALATALLTAFVCTSGMQAAHAEDDPEFGVGSLVFSQNISTGATNSDATEVPGETASLSGSGFNTLAISEFGSNHVRTEASDLSPSNFAVGGLSTAVDKITVTGGQGTGVAEFTVHLNGAIDVGAIYGAGTYLLTGSEELAFDDEGMPTEGTTLESLASHNFSVVPFADAQGFNAAVQSNLPDIAPADQVFGPGAGQTLDLVLTGSYTFNYDDPFFVTSTLSTNLFDTETLVAALELEEFGAAASGATVLDFSNSATIVSIVLPQGASASFASGASYNVTTAVPEPAEWGMLLAGLALVGWQAKRRLRG